MRLGKCFLLTVLSVAVGCTGPHQNVLPPAERIMHPGPGVDGPGPGVMTYAPAVAVPPMPSQVAFVGPEGTQIQWDVGAPGAFDSAPLVVPARYNFPQGAIYRRKLTNIPARPGVELYPTLEVGASQPRTAAFLAHNAIPVGFTEEDLDQVLSGNFVTKVIYLPDAEYQELALAGVETLGSTRLDPGVDPIVEADRRGAILGIVRLGNKDLEVAGGEVAAAGYAAPIGAGGPLPCPPGAPGGPVPGMVAPTNYISGVNGPEWGMPTCGTPIGLPGPPHVPFGVPAGLQKHTMVNWTPMHIPQPSQHMRIDVRQDPGMSYPKPANHAFIVEKTQPGGALFHQPIGQKREIIQGGAAACPPGTVLQ